MYLEELGFFVSACLDGLVWSVAGTGSLRR
jgi:hypothetical protein